MKKLIYIAMGLLLCLFATLWYGCEEKETETEKDQPGALSGVVIDKDTKEIIAEAKVALRPGNQNTQTDAEGRFVFKELEPRTYELNVEKIGYDNETSDKIVVKPGTTVTYNVQLKKNPPSLKILNAANQEIYELDFGANVTRVKGSFYIFNAGSQALQWGITKTAAWITDISMEQGELEAGKSQTIDVVIDREQLAGGDNNTVLFITSNGGNKQFIVKAIGEKRSLPILNTLNATEVKRTSAILQGMVTNVGIPEYTERGFVYSLSSMPTIETTISKLIITKTTDKSFHATVTELEEGKTYYARAYAINKIGTAYSSNEVSFVPQKSLPIVKTGMVTNKSIAMGQATLNGTIEYVGEPVYIERGFVYGTARNPAIEDAIKSTVTGHWSVEYAVNLADFKIGEIYYARAYATNEAGTAYGKETVLDFRAILPEVQTLSVTDVDEHSATLQGTIKSIGEPSYTEAGFVYGTMLTPSLDNVSTKQVSVTITGAGNYSKKIENLKDGETYYVRSYLRNEHYTAYGTTVSFKAENPYYVILPEVGLMVQKKDLGMANWYTAESMCKNSITAGYTDWRLPTIDELMTLYISRNLIGSFGEYSYWSSTKYDDGLPYGEDMYGIIDFGNGRIDIESVSYTRSVRAVRTITR